MHSVNQPFYYQFETDRIVLTIKNQRNHFYESISIEQTIIDQTNLLLNTNAIVYVNSELNKIVVESKQN
jgi:hypothetical protein